MALEGLVRATTSLTFETTGQVKAAIPLLPRLVSHGGGALALVLVKKSGTELTLTFEAAP